MRFVGLCALLVGCSATPELEDPKPLVDLGGVCSSTIECNKGLFCAGGRCAEPEGEAQTEAVDIATLERKIGETRRHEAKAFTEDGKRRMRKQRAELEAKLVEARAAHASP